MENNNVKPVVGIIMGSQSDMSVMKSASEILQELGISHEVAIVSAHRTPDRLVEYAREAKSRGIQVIIAGAGGAAHLPGMTAALTAIPVIGVPVKVGDLSGVDALYSIVQMPGGIPVATVAINGAKNAGILAAQILGVSDDVVYQAVERYKQGLEKSVLQSAKDNYQVF